MDFHGSWRYVFSTLRNEANTLYYYLFSCRLSTDPKIYDLNDSINGLNGGHNLRPSIDRGSTGSGGSTDPPLSQVWGQSMLFDPHFFMHKSMVVSLFIKARSVKWLFFIRRHHYRNISGNRLLQQDCRFLKHSIYSNIAMYSDRTRAKHDSSFSIVICIADCKIF